MELLNEGFFLLRLPLLGSPFQLLVRAIMIYTCDPFHFYSCTLCSACYVFCLCYFFLLGMQFTLKKKKKNSGELRIPYPVPYPVPVCVTGNLWLVKFNGCILQPMAKTNHKFPDHANRKYYERDTEFEVLLNSLYCVSNPGYVVHTICMVCCTRALALAADAHACTLQKEAWRKKKACHFPVSNLRLFDLESAVILT